jgi:flagellar biosynthetic protein FliR
MIFDDLELAQTFDQLWMLLFLSIRVGAAMMAAPLFGGVSVPMQLRIVLSMVIGLFIVSWVPLPAPPDPLSMDAVFAVMQEAVIGLALGFVLQVGFAVPYIAAEQISGTMGLAIATSIDPNSGSQSGAIGQLFSFLLALLFLTLGAHLLWFELIIESYRLFPAGEAGFGAAQGEAMGRFAGLAFATAAAIALPIVLVLLLVQLVTGIISRSAPSLNLFALGLPAGLLAGLAAIIITMPIIFEQFENLTEMMLGWAAELVTR